MKALFCLIVLSLTIQSVHSQSSANVIHWELVRPFRFITDEARWKELRTAYDEMVGDKTAANLEKTLQEQSDSRTNEIRSRWTDCKNAEPGSKKYFECHYPYYGWFARLAENNYADTCWDPDKLDYRREGKCEDYIHPRFHRVRAWIDPPVLASQVRWSYKEKSQPTSSSINASPCLSPRFSSACIEFDIPFDDILGKSSGDLTARLGDGIDLKPVPIDIEDKLIVGLGDSYASGEGNPDRPASFVDGRTDRDWLLTHDIEPKRDKGGQPLWLDRGCHRSMYSYQFKTALQLALNHPQTAITFVSYSCSGATTENIISKRQKPQEGTEKIPPQLIRLATLLGSKAENTQRPIDYLLLSTGGNDVNFAKYVEYVLLNRHWHPLVKMFGMIAIPKDKETRNSIKALLLDNYTKLRDELFKKLTIRVNQGCTEGSNCSRVVFTPYPNPMYRADNDLCSGNVFDQRFTNDSKRASRVVKVNDFVAKPLLGIQEAAIGQGGLGWNFVKEQLEKYNNHGFCAGESTSGVPEDSMLIPSFKNKLWQHTKPWDYKSYDDTMQRWFRIPRDSKLTTDQRSRHFGILIDWELEDIRSNIMHPTAKALAVTADANVQIIERIK